MALKEQTVRELCAMAGMFARTPNFMLPGQELVVVCVPPYSRERLNELIAKCNREMAGEDDPRRT